MGLADKGGSSGFVGQRWADMVDAWAATLLTGVRLPAHADAPSVSLERVIRLDDTPGIAAAASRRAMQNPDFLFLGEHDGEQVLQAADAKFSVETARAKQVSAEVVRGLFDLGPVIEPLLRTLPKDMAIVPGLFLVPDYPLTHLMLRRRHGIVRTTVDEREVIFVPAPAIEFLAGLEGREVVPVMAAVDNLAVSPKESLLAALYYFRLTRAAVGCWIDSVKPLLLLNDRVEVNIDEVVEQTLRRANRATTGFGLVIDWNIEIDRVREQRQAVEHVAGLPIQNRDLRNLVQKMADQRGLEAPSLNQVRRRLGNWYRQELRDRVGPMPPPIVDFGDALQRLGKAGAEVAPGLVGQAKIITSGLLDQAEAGEAASTTDSPD